MSILDQKQNILNTLNAYSSFLQQPEVKHTQILSSVNNKNDVTSFILDIIKCVAGVDGLKESIGGMFTDVLSGSEDKIKTALKKHVTQLNFDSLIPVEFQTNGIDIPVKNIDVRNKFRINPESDSGKLIYKADDTYHQNFDNVLYDAAQTPNTDFLISDMGVKLKFNDVNEMINIKPIAENNLKIGELFNNYIDNAQIVNKNEITTNLMDSIYGTFSKKNNRTKEEIINNKKIQKIFAKVEEEDYSFELSPDEINQIFNESEDLVNGVCKYNIGCDVVYDNISFDELNDMVDEIINSDNKFEIANSFSNRIGKSNDTLNENTASVLDGFFTKLIKLLINLLVEAATIQPQVKVIFILFDYFMNGGVLVEYDNIVEMLKSLKNFIICIVYDIIDQVCEYLFNLAVSYMVKLIEPIIKKIINERISQYTKQLASLIGLNEINNLIS